jgi:hypothetical protein
MSAVLLALGLPPRLKLLYLESSMPMRGFHTFREPAVPRSRAPSLSQPNRALALLGLNFGPDVVIQPWIAFALDIFEPLA